MRFASCRLLITGGAGGIGRALARSAVEAGAAEVVLWDVDPAGLREAVRTTDPGRVRADVVDVADVAAIERAARQELDRHGALDILVNNAGVVVGRRFVEHSAEDVERTIRINLLGAMHVTRALLPAMVTRGRGHVVNVASAAGLTPTPDMAVYAASKWGVVGWSESLRVELGRDHPGLRVTTVCPSFVATGMFEGARPPRLTPLLTSDALARRIVRAVERDRPLLLAPRSVRLLTLLRGVLGTRAFDTIVGGRFGVYRSMERFVGRGTER